MHYDFALQGVSRNVAPNVDLTYYVSNEGPMVIAQPRKG